MAVKIKSFRKLPVAFLVAYCEMFPSLFQTREDEQSALRRRIRLFSIHGSIIELLLHVVFRTRGDSCIVIKIQVT